MNPFDDRTAEEKLPQNKDIVAFLHHVTASLHTSSQEMQAQAVTRVRSRLLEKGQLHMKHITLPTIQPIEHEETSQEKVPSIALLRKRPVWQQHLSPLVAVLCVALLVGSFIAVQQLVHHDSSATSTSSRNGSHPKDGQFVYFPIVQVHMNGLKFKQSSVVIHKGMGIELISDDHVECIISNGYWEKNADAVPLKEKGIPKVDFIRIGYTYPTSRIIGPFNTIGTYHLYDTIHSDKTLTVLVQK